MADERRDRRRRGKRGAQAARGDISGGRLAPDRERLVTVEIDRANVRWEIQVHRMMFGVVVLAVGMLLAISPWIGARLAGFEIGLCLCAIGYFVTCSALLSRGKALWLSSMGWLAEASFPTVALLIAIEIKGPAWAMQSPMMLIYPLAILTTSIRMRPELCAFATLLEIAEWLEIYHVAILPRFSEAELAATPTLQAWAAWERCFWFAVIGGIATFATHKMRRTAFLGSSQAQRRRMLERELGRFVSPDVAAAVLRGEAAFGAAQRREVTVLFCDLRNFTALCERERPEDVVAMLNAFYARACAAIDDHGGTVNKFLGDGLLALFGAPDAHASHARAASQAARAVLRAAEELRKRGGIWQHLQVGIGLDTGEVVVGAIGGPSRVEYTAIGSIVNRAARLQALSDGGRVVMSDTCARALGERTRTVSLGKMPLKGFAEPVAVFALADSIG
jgi:adenylate cyclase